MKHVFIIHSQSSSHPFIPIIKDVMKEEDYDIHLSMYPGHASDIIRGYKEPTRFYSVGGDGMVNQVMQGIVGTQHELAVIPYGTGNDFVKMLDHPKNPEAALKTMCHKKAVPVDAVKINDSYFMNSCCFGIDAVIANHVHDVIKIPFVKRESYVLGILQQVFGYKFHYVEVYSEGQLLYQGNVTICTFMNGGYYGGGFKIAPDASLTDGMLDVVIVDQINKATMLYPIFLILRKKIHKHKKAQTFKVRAVDIKTRVSANVDGDEMSARDYHLEVLPKGINIVI